MCRFTVRSGGSGSLRAGRGGALPCVQSIAKHWSDRTWPLSRKSPGFILDSEFNCERGASAARLCTAHMSDSEEFDADFGVADPSGRDPDETDALLREIYAHYAVDGPAGEVISGARFYQFARECNVMGPRVMQARAHPCARLRGPVRLDRVSVRPAGGAPPQNDSADPGPCRPRPPLQRADEASSPRADADARRRDVRAPG